MYQNWTIQQSQTVEGSLYITNGAINLNGYILTVKGDLNQTAGIIDVKAGSLIVAGNYNQSVGTLYVDSGQVNIGKDYSITGNSYLKMTNSNDVVTVNGNCLISSSNSHNTYLTAGTLAVKGNFTQNMGTGDNFKTTGTHKVVLSGTTAQNVSFANYSSSYFNILEIANNSAEGVNFSTQVTVYQELISTNSVVVNSKNIGLYNTAIISGGNWHYDLGIFQSWTMQRNQVIEGSVYLSSGVLNANGCGLTVMGDLSQTGGTLKVNGSQISINKNYSLSGSSILQMINNNDRVNVAGNFTMNSTAAHNTYLTAGILEVKGDFTQKSAATYNFKTSGTHKVVLSGTAVQTVNFQNYTSSNFNLLEITNITGGVNFTSTITVTTLKNISNPNYPIPVIVQNPLSENVTVGGDLSIKGGTLDLNWKNLSVTGNMVVENSTVDLKGGKLSIVKNLTQPSGTIYVDAGRMEIGGSYLIQGPNGTGSNGYLKMLNSADYVQVSGEFLTDSMYDHSTYLTSGVLEVKGNFTQKSSYSNGIYNFKTSGTFKTLLSGSGRQNVSFEDPLYSYFSILQITNTLSGVYLTTDACVTGELMPYTNAVVINGSKLKMKGSARISGDWKGSLGVADNWTMSQVTVIDGELLMGSNSTLNLNKLILSVNRLTQSGGTTDVNYGKIIVKDSLYLSGGTININYGRIEVTSKVVHSGGTMTVGCGKLIINGDYLIQSETQNANQTFTYGTSTGVLKMANKADSVGVAGNFTIQSSVNSWGNLTDGLLEVEGNFTQKNSGQIYNFAPSGNHTVLLDGKDKQTITFNNPDYSMFNYVKLTKPEDSGYTFDPALVSKYPAEKSYEEFNKSGSNGVNPATGNYSNTFTDMTLPAPGFTINIARTYNSSLNKDYGYVLKNHVFGKGWVFAYESYIKDFENRMKNPDSGQIKTYYDSNTKIILMPDGSIISFRYEDGKYVGNDTRNTLVKNTDGTYVMTTKDKEKYTYNAAGWLKQITDSKGNSLYINVDTNGKIQSIVDAAGRQFTFTYENNRLKSINDVAASRSVNYEYDTNGRLYTVQDPMGCYTTYTYDTNGNLDSIKDNDGELLESVSYETSGDKKGWVKSITDKNGCTKAYKYETMKTTITEGTGNNARTTVEWYDNAYHPITVQDPYNRYTQITYKKYGSENIGEIMSYVDENGNKTQKEIDDRGNVTKIINPDGSVRFYTYDANDNLTGETDEEGNCTVYKYDWESKLTKKAQYLKKITPGTAVTLNDDGSNASDFAITNYNYYTTADAPAYKAKGLLKEVVEPIGFKTTYSYTVDGNVETVTDYENNTTTYKYDLLRLKKSEQTPKGYITYYNYDNNGRLEISWNNVNDGKSRIVYDSRGRKVKEVSPNAYFSEYDDMVSHNYDPDDMDTKYYRYEYDDTARTKTVTDPCLNQTVYTYDIFGNLATEEKPNHVVYYYYYDKLNRLTKTAVQEGPASEPITLEEYSYDTLVDRVLPNNVILMKTQKTVTRYIVNGSNTSTTVTRYQYDFAGRLIEQQNPDNTSVKTTYYSNGKVKTTIDAAGSTSFYKYDYKFDQFYNYDPQYVMYEAKRIPVEKDSSGTIKYVYSETIYDISGLKREERVGVEKVVLSTYPSNYITTKYDYYMNGRLKTVAESGGRTTWYEYDGDGNVAKETVSIDSSKVRTTEYTNNYFGKPELKKESVDATDIYGNYNKPTLDTSYTYDLNGNLKTVTTPDNVTTTYGYDTMDRQTSVIQQGQDEYGNQVDIKTGSWLNWAGKPYMVIDARHNYTYYDYTPMGQLKKVSKTVDGVTKTTAYYCYDSAGRKVAEVSGENYDSSKTIDQMNRTAYKYDSMDRVKTVGYTGKEMQVDPQTLQLTPVQIDIVTKAYDYDNNGNVIKEQDALGYENGYGTVYVYNLANQVVQVLDPENKTRGYVYAEKYEYDTLGRKTSEEKVNGFGSGKYNSKKWYEYDDAGNIKTVKVKRNIVQDENTSPTRTIQANTYDYEGNLLTQTNGKGNTTQYEYTLFNKVRKVTYPGGEHVVNYKYDVMGNVKEESDNSKVKLYTYDNQGRQLSCTEQKTDGSESITVSAIYDVNGNKRFETDGNGNQKEYTYDELNRLETSKTQVITADGRSVWHTTVNGYDLEGNIVTQTEKVESGTLTSSTTSTNVYDALSRLVEKKDQYNKSIQKLVYNHNSAQIKSYDASNNDTLFEYDKNGRLTKTTDPEGHNSSQTHDNSGNVRTKVDGKGNTTTYNYDEFGRLENVINALNQTTYYTYDLNGNMLTQKDAKGNTTIMEYNSYNKVSTKTDAGGKSESYDYYIDGSLKEKTDRNGAVTTYYYDIHGRLTSQVTTRTGYAALSVSYTYDDNGNQLTMSDITGVTTRTYDSLNRVMTKYVPNIGTTTFIYDIISNRTDMESGLTAETSVDPKGNETTKVYDKVGRLGYVIDGDINAPVSASYKYDDNGNRECILYKDGSREDYTYYNDNLLWTLTNKKPDGTQLEAYTYEYDAAHNQTKKTDNKGDTIYTYDALNRLNTVTEPSGKVTSYTFDAAGNRSTETITTSTGILVNTYAYDSRNRLTSVSNGSGATYYAYDDNGNQLTVTSNGQILSTNTYDLLNQLITTEASGKTVVNTYNGEGLRVAKQAEGLTTNYLYEYDKVVLELDSSGNQVGRNIYGTNLLNRTVQGQTLNYMYNGHGDVTALTDANTGTVTSTYYYDAFGNIVEQTGNVNNNITFGGYQYDKETGLYYLNARMYDPITARFLQEDTYTGNINDPLSLNLYTYCQNEPIMYFDPAGHDSTLINYRGSYYTLREMNDITNYSKNGNNETKQVKKEVYPGHYEWVSIPTSYTYEENMERYYGNLYRILDEMEFNLNDYTSKQVNEAHQRMKDSGLTFSGNWFEKWLFEDTGFGLEIKSQQTKAQQSMSLHYVVAEHFKSEWDAYMSNSTATLQGAGVFISSGYGTPKTPSASDASISKLDHIEKNGVNSGPTNYTKPTIVQNLERAGNAGVGKSIISPEMENKILHGERANGNKLIGGHSPQINNSNPNYAVEVISENADGTKVVKFTTQYSDGNLAKIKTSTLFPEKWSDQSIIESIKTVGDTPAIGVRDNLTLHRSVVNGVEIDVIKDGNIVTAGYPTGGKLTPGFNPIPK